MKKLAILFLIMVSFAAGAARAQVPEDIQKHRTCKYCDMDRLHYAHSRMLVEYSDGTSFGSCSLHCTAVDLALNIGKTPISIMAGDYNTGELINAEAAFWVIGGDRPGVMTRRAKWAFGKKRDADEFVRIHGGRASSFDEALKASYEDMYLDSRMIRDRRKIRKMIR